MSFAAVILAGWGIHSTAMQPLVESLSQHMPTYSLALPGFVNDHLSTDKLDWSGLVDALHTQLNMYFSEKQHLSIEQYVMIGWSMGGQLATAYTNRFPNRVIHLITLSCNPCFVKRSNTRDGVELKTFDKFLYGIQNNTNTTLTQFYLLCSQGNKLPRKTLMHFKKARTKSQIQKQKLFKLLQLLKNTDSYDWLDAIKCNMIHFFARQDQLIPQSVFEQMRNKLSDKKTKLIQGGHSFWLDTPSIIVKQIKNMQLDRSNKHT